jgi:hypothetical protein
MTPRSCTTSTLSFEVMQIIETPDSVEPPEDVHAADSARIWPAARPADPVVSTARCGSGARGRLARFALADSLVQPAIFWVQQDDGEQVRARVQGSVAVATTCTPASSSIELDTQVMAAAGRDGARGRVPKRLDTLDFLSAGGYMEKIELEVRSEEMPAPGVWASTKLHSCTTQPARPW